MIWKKNLSHPNYRLDTINALLDHGASRRDFEVRELSRPNQLRIQLGTSMDEKGHPFYQMPDVNPNEGQVQLTIIRTIPA